MSCATSGSVLYLGGHERPLHRIRTNILILASQGKFDLLTLYDLFDDVLISIVTQVEALGFNFTSLAEEQAMSSYFQDMTVLPFGEAEAYYAISHRKQQKKIKFPDAATPRPALPVPTC